MAKPVYRMARTAAEKAKAILPPKGKDGSHLLGTGGAAKAAQAVKTRQSRIDDLVDAATSTRRGR